MQLWIVGVLLVAVGLAVWWMARKKVKSHYRLLDNSESCSSGACRDHPVLRYQRRASGDNHPASYGDPIRPPMFSKPY